MIDKPLLILQARTGSTRLPKKMVRPFYQNKTIPQIIIENLLKHFDSNRIVLATSTNKGDDELEKLCSEIGISCFRGSENNVLKRFIDCAIQYKGNRLVRICADNPFLLPEFILELTKELDVSGKEYISFQWKDLTPVMLSHIGVFAEAMTLNFLKKIQNSTEDPLYLEHVTNYIYTHKNEFDHKFLNLPQILEGRENIRLTVDTESDFNTTQELYSKMMEKKSDFELMDLLELIDENPVLIDNMEAQIDQNAK
ncbi:MAG: hypothetical protein KDC84_08195 [Crocinitomicaceae bacterium]|nr:hypothetical protein [Crocinitomicaceae bacterium]